jgi:hypothetical protein
MASSDITCRLPRDADRRPHHVEPLQVSRDAACVGEGGALIGSQQPTLAIKAMGRGSYCRTSLDKYGFPGGYCMPTKRVCGFRRGDVVRAVCRVAVRVRIVQHRQAQHVRRMDISLKRADRYGFAGSGPRPNRCPLSLCGDSRPRKF